MKVAAVKNFGVSVAQQSVTGCYSDVQSQQAATSLHMCQQNQMHDYKCQQFWPVLCSGTIQKCLQKLDHCLPGSYPLDSKYENPGQAAGRCATTLVAWVQRGKYLREKSACPLPSKRKLLRAFNFSANSTPSMGPIHSWSTQPISL